MEKSDNTAVLVFGIIAVVLIIASTDYLLFKGISKLGQISTPVNVSFAPPSSSIVINNVGGPPAPVAAPVAAPDNGITPLDCNNVTNLSDAMQCANIGF